MPPDLESSSDPLYFWSEEEVEDVCPYEVKPMPRRDAPTVSDDEDGIVYLFRATESSGDAVCGSGGEGCLRLAPISQIAAVGSAGVFAVPHIAEPSDDLPDIPLVTESSSNALPWPASTLCGSGDISLHRLPLRDPVLHEFSVSSTRSLWHGEHSHSHSGSNGSEGGAGPKGQALDGSALPPDTPDADTSPPTDATTFMPLDLSASVSIAQAMVAKSESMLPVGKT
ncbi:hypothetical protein KIPB_001890, partial [Kipferlia bialata]|eukprot:g1890.t1